MDPAGSRAAIRAGHDPFAGSVAPTPTLSDAPIATYRTAGAGDVAAGEGAGVVVLAAVVLGAVASTGLAVRGGVDADEHAARKAAHNRVQMLPERFTTGTIVLPKENRASDSGHGDAWFRQGRQTTANTSYALAA